MSKIEGCYLLLGSDSWSKNKFITEIKNKILSDPNDMMNYFEAKDKEVVVSNITDVMETLPFFNDKKLVYIKDTGLFKAGRKEESEKFELLIQSIPEYVVLLIDEKEVDKRGKLYKAIHSRYKVIVFDYPGEEVVYEMLRAECDKEGIKIDTATLRYFIRNMPEDLSYMISEWRKLVDYVDRNVITKEAIQSICVFSLETRVFEMVKKMAGRQIQEALEIYSRMIQSKESPLMVLTLIARQYRMMLQVKYLQANRKDVKGISGELKLPYFAVKEMVEEVKNYSFKQLEEMVEACLNADRDIKAGRMEMNRCVELLIMQSINN